MNQTHEAAQALLRLADSIEERDTDEARRDTALDTGVCRAYDNAESPMVMIEVTAGVVTDVWISDEALHIYQPGELAVSLNMVMSLAYDLYYEGKEETDGK